MAPDPILTWNAVALEANRVSHSNGKFEQVGPTLSARALAIVHLAMYEAYAKLRGNPQGLEEYGLCGLPSVPRGATAEAVVAGAAFRTLTVQFPSQAAFFQAWLDATGDEDSKGHEFGVTVADAMLEDRAGDPDAGSAGYRPSSDRCRHREDPDNPGQGFHAPFYGARSRGFAITRRHELPPPPSCARNEAAYLAALRQVRAKGIRPELAGTLPPDLWDDRRTPEQTLEGIYWAYDGAVGLGTPPRLYNQIIREVARAQGNDTDRNARLFALVNVAMADAGILAWEQKYIHELWRPVVGIREHDPSFGPGATCGANDLDAGADPEWLPLGAPNTNTLAKNFTPSFPAYPSGHATFGAAAFHVTRLFYGVRDRKDDDLFEGRTFVSDELNGASRDNRGAVRPRHVRSFPGGLWQMIVENGLSRVFLGVHWVFDAFSVDGRGRPDLSTGIGGVPLGLDIAEDIYDTGMKISTVKPCS